MAKTPMKPKNLSAPGADPRAAESDVEQAIEAGRSGKARKIAKPKPEVGVAKVKQLDSLRPKTMPVNQKTEMSYEAAMALHKSGEQTRAILTPLGWVAPPDRTPESAKRAVGGAT